jgi:hypothetical protein
MPTSHLSEATLRTTCSEDIEEFLRNVSSVDPEKSFSVLIPLAFSMHPAMLEVLDHPDAANKLFAINLFTLLLNHDVADQMFPFVALLTILGFRDPRKREQKRLLASARGVLARKIDLLHVSAEVVAPFNKNFSRLLELSSASHFFLAGVLQRLLATAFLLDVGTGEKSQLGTFIIKCNEAGVAPLVLSGECTMFLAGVVYPLPHAVFEQVLRAALAQPGVLSDGYCRHVPLFQRSVLSEAETAAIDVPDAVSVTAPTTRRTVAHVDGVSANSGTGASVLQVSRWKGTVMFRSNQNRVTPSSGFLLLEHRDLFGRLVILTRPLLNIVGGGQSVAVASNVCCNPLATGPERRRIFGAMESNSLICSLRCVLSIGSLRACVWIKGGGQKNSLYDVVLYLYTDCYET